MSDLPDIKDIRRMALGPDDVLVIRYREHSSHQHASQLRDHLRSALPHSNKVLVLDDGADLDVLTPDRLEQLTDTT